MIPHMTPVHLLYIMYRGRGQQAWWRHQMETFSALLAFCARNSPVTGEFLSKRPMTRSFDAFLDLHLNKRLSKQSCGWWFETPSRSLWRHCMRKQKETRDNYKHGSMIFNGAAEEKKLSRNGKFICPQIVSTMKQLPIIICAHMWCFHIRPEDVVWCNRTWSWYMDLFPVVSALQILTTAPWNHNNKMFNIQPSFSLLMPASIIKLVVGFGCDLLAGSHQPITQSSANLYFSIGSIEINFNEFRFKMPRYFTIIPHFKVRSTNVHLYISMV